MSIEREAASLDAPEAAAGHGPTAPARSAVPAGSAGPTGPTAWRSPAIAPDARVPVWAPSATAVELHLTATGELVAMERGPQGWWLSPVPVPDGADYAFRVDGSPDRPDPRSAHQPHGVHGPSRRVETSAWREGLWSDASWPGREALGAVIYELHVGTFTPEGTLGAAAQRLDHLAALGVDMVELMPLAPFPGTAGWGYDGVSLWAVHEAYGGPAALAAFVDAAHRAGIAVCLDVVYNHLGPSGNYLSAFGPYFTGAHHTPWGEAVNFDQEGSAQVRAYVIDAALRWLRDFHIDALRLDAIHAIVDDSPRHVLAELSEAVAALSHELGRPLSLIAESDLNDVAVISPTSSPSATGAPALGMSAQWADDVHHALHARLTGESQGYYADFAEPGAWLTAYNGAFLHDGRWSSFRGRTWGAPVPAGTDPRRFVVFASNHDQVGNRAVGDRPSQSLEDSTLAAQAALVLLSPYTPMIFMGEEWGTRTPFQFFTDHDDPGLAAGVSAGRAQEFAGFGWQAEQIPDPQDPATFAASRLDWQELERADHARMLEWYRALISLRRSLDWSRRRAWPVAEEHEGLITVTYEDLVVAVNLSAAHRPVPTGLCTLLAWQPQSGTVLDPGQTLIARPQA